MPGGIQNIDAEAIKLKLHGRGGHGDAALLLNVHPVRGGVLVAFACFHAAGGTNGASIEQELFRQGGFTGVRVRNNGEGSPLFYLIVQHGGKFRRLDCGQHDIPPGCNFRFTQVFILQPQSQRCQGLRRLKHGFFAQGYAEKSRGKSCLRRLLAAGCCTGQGAWV